MRQVQQMNHSATSRQSRRQFHQHLAQTALGLSAAGLLAGCETKEELTASAGTARPAATGKGLKIGMIAKSNSNPVFLAARKGAESRAAALSDELGLSVTLDWRTPNDEDAQKQAEFIEQLVSSGAAGLAIACSDASKVTRAIDDAIAKGVQVMCFDSDAPESKRLCYVGTDDYEAGRLVMEHVSKLLEPQSGVIAILAGNQTATNLQKRVKGASDELARHEHLRLKGVYYHKETPQEAYAMVESVQQANPEINGWAMIGGWPLMTDRALPWAPGKVVCVSMDTLLPQLEHLRKGDVQLLLGQRYFYFGERCVEIMTAKIRSGTSPAQEVEFAPLDPVTRENVEEYAKNWARWS
jgi:ribose transport system substrate-binding protein